MWLVGMVTAGWLTQHKDQEFRQTRFVKFCIFLAIQTFLIIVKHILEELSQNLPSNFGYGNIDPREIRFHLL